MPSESACTLLASSPRPKGTRRGTALAPADEWTRAVEQTLAGLGIDCASLTLRQGVQMLEHLAAQGWRRNRIPKQI